MNGDKACILLVDDEPDILEFLSYNLEKSGFKVETAANGIEGLQKAKTLVPDLIILDVMMPEMNGLETCKEIRKLDALKESRIAFLTASDEDSTQIEGLNTGADDFISKPIKPNVFLARVNALLRRAAVPKISEAGGIKVDLETRKIKFKDKDFELPRKEFDLLLLLISKPGKVFTREDILKKVWGGDVVVGDRTIDVHIRKLRERFGDNLFKTVKGVGYKFEF